MKLNIISAEVQKHWAENLINAIKAYRRKDYILLQCISVISGDCAYCRTYDDYTMVTNRVCCGCPVAEITGCKKCCNTPYRSVVDILNNLICDRKYFNFKDLVKAVWKEYLFLKKTYKGANDE